VVNRLFKADYFGEKALLSNEPRNASVVASQETVCLALDRDTFKEILGPYEEAMVVSTHGPLLLHLHMQRMSALVAYSSFRAHHTSC
jgi:CRP-like cAMP-binding protein